MTEPMFGREVIEEGRKITEGTLFDKAEAMNELLNLDMNLTINHTPILIESKTGNFWSGCVPWMLFNGEELLLDRTDYRAVEGFLSGLEWLGTTKVVR